MNQVMFTIIVVSLNPGKQLSHTINSILEQTYTNYQIVIKDGLSADGVVGPYIGQLKIVVNSCKDTGIYDAMNQAIYMADGMFTLFLNCGDSFYDKEVLKKAAEYITREENKGNHPGIFYGNTFCEQIRNIVSAPPVINSFACFRNIPCHQSCFYDTTLLKKKPFDLDYSVRADYEQFLWCCYQGKCKPFYMDMTVSSYEGGGFSESRENSIKDKLEHKQIVKLYMSGWELFIFNAYLIVTLAPFRKRIAESKELSGAYNALKKKVYRK